MIFMPMMTAWKLLTISLSPGQHLECSVSAHTQWSSVSLQKEEHWLIESPLPGPQPPWHCSPLHHWRQSCIEPNPGVSGFTTRYHRALRPSSSMRHWKVAGALNKPNTSVTNWNEPYGVEKTVFSFDSGWLNQVLWKIKHYLIGPGAHRPRAWGRHQTVTLYSPCDSLHRTV